MPLVQVQQGEPRKKHLLRQVLFSMISVPYGTDDISSIRYPLSADDICLRHMNGTDIISCLRRKYIIRRKPYIILRQQYIMMYKASLGDLFLLAFLLLHLNYQTCGYQSPSPTELSEVGGKACDAPPAAEEASRVWRSGQFFVSVSEQEKLGTTRGSVTYSISDD